MRDKFWFGSSPIIDVFCYLPDFIAHPKGPQPRKVAGVRLNDVRPKPEKKSETLKRLLKQKGRK